MEPSLSLDEQAGADAEGVAAEEQRERDERARFPGWDDPVSRMPSTSRAAESARLRPPRRYCQGRWQIGLAPSEGQGVNSRLPPCYGAHGSHARTTEERAWRSPVPRAGPRAGS